MTHSYNDELIHSTIARFQRNMNLNSSRINLILFSCPTNVNNRESGFSVLKLNSLVEKMGFGIDANGLVNTNTPYLYDTAFCPEDIAYRVKEIYLNGGRPYKHFQRNFLRYCSSCALKDNDTFGEPYFHTIHQLDGVFICPTCHKPLLNYPIGDLFNYICLDPKYLVKDNLIKINNIYNEIADMAKSLLENKSYNFHYIDLVIGKITTLLKEKKLLYGKKIKKDLFLDIKEKYAIDETLYEYYSFDIDDVCREIPEILKTHKDHQVRTIVYLILINYLVGDLESFIKITPYQNKQSKRDYQERSYETIRKYRDLVISLINADSKYTRILLMQQYPSAYSCLICNDKEWLSGKLPAIFQVANAYNVEYDNEICDIVKQTASDLISHGQRVYKGSLRKNDLLRTPLRRLDHLPVTKSCVESVIETIEQYDRRVITSTIDIFIKNNVEFTYFKVAKVSGVSRSRFQNLKTITDEHLIELGLDPIKLRTGSKQS